jgi:4-hydroxyphenylpyruvate dioxygenase
MSESKTNAVNPHSSSRIDGIHHIEIYVSNNYQAAHFYRSTLGFSVTGTTEPTRVADSTSIAMRRSEMLLLLTSPIVSSSPVADHIRLHGEGVKDIALSVTGVDHLFHTAISRGARPILNPTTQEDDCGLVRTARIATCGDLIHSLIERSRYRGISPGIVAVEDWGFAPDTALDSIDHLALALDEGQLDEWVEFYISALGFRETHQEEVNTEYSAMRSKVVQSPNGAVRFPMMEPAKGRRRSQIENYIQSHQGPGAQHLALCSTDIVKSVSVMATAGIQFLATPATYYDSLQARVGELSLELDGLRRLGILVDRDARGLLLQVFTKAIEARPTLFLEVIERRGAVGFGSGNIRALFEAVERAQIASA